VRNGEAGDVEIADGETLARLEGFEHRNIFTPIDILRGAVSEIDRNGPDRA
jgi:hypothetical protein